MTVFTDSDAYADPISVRVVEALASANGIDAVDVEPPLYDAIDPGALDRLYLSDGDCRVVFGYQDRRVEVRGDGSVSIDGTVYDDGR